jgi:hypothetical protein
MEATYMKLKIAVDIAQLALSIGLLAIGIAQLVVTLRMK